MIARKSKIFYGYIMIAAVSILYFITMAIPTYGVSVLNARMVEATGMQSDIVGIGVSLATLMQGLSAPIVGSLIRNRGVKFPYLIGSVLVTAGCFLMAYLTLNEFLFIAYYGLLMGTGMGFAGILSLQSSMNVWFNRRRAFAMGISMASGGLAGLVLPILLGAVADASSWQGGWFFSGCMCVFPVLVVILFIVNRPEDIGEVPDGLKYTSKHAAQTSASASLSNAVDVDVPLSIAYRSSAFYIIAFNVAAKWMLYYAFTGHVVIYLMQTGVDRLAAGLAISSFSIASMLGRLLIGMVPETVLSPRNNNSFSTILMSCGMIALLLLPKSVISICVCTSVMGFTFGTSMIGFPLLVSNTFGKTNFPTVNAKMALVQNMLGAIGPLAVGFIATTLESYDIAYWAFILLALISGIVIHFVKPPQTPSDA